VSDWYRDFANSGFGTTITKQLGLPRPAVLRRYEPGQPLLPGPAVIGSAGQGRLREQLSSILKDAGVAVQSPVTADGATDGEKPAAVILDATGLSSPADLASAHDFLAPAIKRLRATGRVLVIGEPAAEATSVPQAAARQALDGLVRSIGKELRDGSTANLLYVPDGAEGSLAGPVRFFLSGRSAYVDGQPVTLSAAEIGAQDEERPLAGKVAVVTGAARGIGASIARVMARDGAHVVAVDIPAAGQSLAEVANEIGGTAFQLDITAADAAERLIAHLKERHGGVDVVVHNAGITRDKLLVNMDAERWNSVLAVNLQAQLDITQALLDDANGVLKPGARVVCVSSQSGIAGNRGQTNYAASKAGVIGMVRAWAPAFAERRATINAVAPGFIVTEMTAKMPFGTREVGARLNSLQQGGLPVDVAETIAWLSQPASAGVNGQVVRVCGQSMLGA
jgi:3-oxoacyl-[acyl-carrier protein] reductase